MTRDAYILLVVRPYRQCFNRKHTPTMIPIIRRVGRVLKHYLIFLTRRWIQLLVVIAMTMYLLSWVYPGRSFYYPQDRQVNRLGYKYITSPQNVCGGTNNPSVLIFVLSTAQAYAKRQAIRDTWGSVSRSGRWPSRRIPATVKVVYLFGHSREFTLIHRLQREASVYGDILQIGIEESYGLHVTKKILMGFKWAREHCPGTQHVMKVDDDVFVDLPQVLHRLQSPEWSSYLCGHVVLLSVTRRSGKYQLSFQEYPYILIPPYILGYFYVMPMDVSSKLVDVSEYVPYLRMEDVYITAILSRMIKVQIKGFQTFFSDRNYDVDTCDFVSQRRDASVDVSPDKMYLVWKTYSDDNICKYV
ncbi:beta-1,3-galactosyltransferase 5-like isoform X2 [Haliotis rufescens]|nr:beta-1,3-galactosyltransferase 5-like isoform X2 [Haliotis rufescens]XP_046378612.2 beta-1,3-galactosyltransferase 5-like isoform X2 [Haliotis rufescens]XP_046378613.2 beta-1,3-galactosyltransferase 5-like isoform X2 [Haliotis rufescens]XP_046378614.2 beta-1,3-galactosyltransferase 5-like isoform X2 [Haliotis rufescens]